MLGPKITIEYERNDKLTSIELGPPIDEQAAIKTMTKWMNSNRNRLFLTLPGAETESAEKDWMLETAKKENCYLWLVYVNQQLIGDIALTSINTNHGNAELGILIGERDFWGRGIAPVIEAAVADFAFRNIVTNGLNKLYAYVVEGNDRSQKALGKVGFRTVGIFKDEVYRNGRWHDCWCSELLARKWRRNRKTILKKLGVKSLNTCPGCEDVGLKPELF